MNISLVKLIKCISFTRIQNSCIEKYILQNKTLNKLPAVVLIIIHLHKIMLCMVSRCWSFLFVLLQWLIFIIILHNRSIICREFWHLNKLQHHSRAQLLIGIHISSILALD